MTKIKQIGRSVCWIVMILVLLTFKLVIANRAFAQNPSRAELRVSPATAFLRLKPGSAAIHTITLENTGNEMITISPQIVDFKPDGESGQPILQSTLNFPYLEIPAEGFASLRLEAKQTAQLNLRIKVPGDALAREYPLMVLFNQVGEPNIDQGSSLVSIGSSLVVLVAKEQFQPEIKVVDIQMPLIVDSFRGFEFVPILANEQLAAAAASGSASLSNWKNQTLVKFELFPTVVLGGSRRRAQALSVSSADNPQIIALAVRQFLLGPYKVQVETQYFDPETGKLIPVSTISRLIFALPIWLLVLSFVVGVFLILIKKWQKNKF